MDLWRIAARAIVAYVYLLITTRASGKRVISQASPFELMLSLIVGDLIDDALWAEVSMAKFGAATVTIALCDGIGKVAAFYSPRVHSLLNGDPTVVLRDGREDKRALKSEQLSEADLSHLLRLDGIEDRSRVHLGTIETNHEASAILLPQEEPATKEDADKVKEKRR